MHRKKLKPVGMTACWIGGNREKGGARECMDSYCFCGKSKNDSVMNAMSNVLSKQIDEAFPGSDINSKNERAKNIMQHFAVPCPGCQMNEIRYKEGLPEIKWVNTPCTDIADDKIVGGTEAMVDDTPDESYYNKARGN